MDLGDTSVAWANADKAAFHLALQKWTDVADISLTEVFSYWSKGDVNGDGRADFSILVKVGKIGSDDFIL